MTDYSGRSNNKLFEEFAAAAKRQEADRIRQNEMSARNEAAYREREALEAERSKDQSLSTRETRARNRLKKLGYRLEKARGQFRDATYAGGYRVCDNYSGTVVLGGSGTPYSEMLSDVEDFITAEEQELAQIAA